MRQIDDAIAARAASQHGLIELRQLEAMGGDRFLAARRVRAGRWRVVAPRVYRLEGAPVTWHQHLLALILATGGIASHRAAAVLHRLTGYRRAPFELTVLRHTRIVRRGATFHETLAFDLVPRTTIDAIPVTTPARTLVDIAGITSERALQALVDAAIRDGACTREELAAAIHTTPKVGHPGLRLVARALERAAGPEPLPESILERSYERVILDAGFPPLQRQVWVHDGRARVLRADYGYPDARIAVEVDSVRFHGQSRFETDRRKRARARSLGWIVLEPTHEQISNDPAGAIRELSDARLQRGLWVPGPHPPASVRR